MTDSKINKETCDAFAAYLAKKKLRKTEERNTILDEICAFPGHFDMDMLQKKLNDTKYHVSKATLYNTLDVLIDAGIVIRHPFDSFKSAQYELRKKAETHMHFICTRCSCVREVKIPPGLTGSINAVKNRFTPDHFSLYIYGTCGRCRNREQRKAQKK